MANVTQLNFNTIIPATPFNKINHYIVIPAFDYSGIIWKGASEIIVQYNYTTTKNFILKEFPVKPTGANFIPCIRYRIGETVYRYKLWGDLGEIMPTVPMYNGEVIKKNCVIEIWNIEGDESVTLEDDLNIILSIKSLPTDYSSVVDEKDVDGSDAVVPLSLVSAMPNSPADTGLAFRYRADDGTFSGVQIITLKDKSGNGQTMDDTSGPNIATAAFADANREYINLTSVAEFVGFSGAANVACKHVFFVFKQATHVANKLICSGGGITFRQVGGGTALLQARVGAVDTEIETTVGMVYIIEAIIRFDDPNYNCIINIYDIYGDLKATETSPATVTPGADTDIYIGDPAGAASAVTYFAEFFGFTDELSADDLKTTLDYIIGYYNNNAILLPNQWAEGSAWLDNV